jgi:hypothetical protein
MDEFLTGGSSLPTAKLENVGDIIKGRVTNVRKLEDKEMNGEPRRWPNGDPKHVFVFDLATSNGEVSLWVRGNMVSAIRTAASTAKVDTLIGSTLTVKFDALGEPKQKGYNAPKLYKAKVEPAAVSADDLL